MKSLAVLPHEMCGKDEKQLIHADRLQQHLALNKWPFLCIRVT